MRAVLVLEWTGCSLCTGQMVAESIRIPRLVALVGCGAGRTRIQYIRRRLEIHTSQSYPGVGCGRLGKSRGGSLGVGRTMP